MDESLFESLTGFEWDVHNVFKNYEKHDVGPAECEEAFFNRPFIVANDIRHSESERRYFALGRSDAGRGLYIVFTIRGSLIRVISVRDMSRKEKSVYGQYEKANP